MAVVDQVLRDGHGLVRSQEDAVAQQLRNRDCLYHLPRISAKGTPARIDRATRNPAGKPCPAVLQLSERVTDERTAAAFTGGLNRSRESVRPPAVRIFRRLPLTSHIHSGEAASLAKAPAGSCACCEQWVSWLGRLPYSVWRRPRRRRPHSVRSAASSWTSRAPHFRGPRSRSSRSRPARCRRRRPAARDNFSCPICGRASTSSP